MGFVDLGDRQSGKDEGQKGHALRSYVHAYTVFDQYAVLKSPDAIDCFNTDKVSSRRSIRGPTQHGNHLSQPRLRSIHGARTVRLHFGLYGFP